MNHCLVFDGPLCIIYGAVKLLAEAMLSPFHIKIQVYSLYPYKQLPLAL